MIPDYSTDFALPRYIHAVRYGHMSLEAALRGYAAWERDVAERYRKLAEEALATQVAPSIFFCAKCGTALNGKVL